MDNIQISLFGKFCVHLNEQDAYELKARKAQELLSYLLLHHECPHHREALANILWDDIPATQSKRYFRRVLWQLQSALSHWSDSSDNPALLIDEEWIEFNPHMPVMVDAVFFERCFECVQDIPGQNLDTDMVQKIQKAIHLYRGDFMEGWYHDWCLFERERFQQNYLSLLDKLMRYFEAVGAYESAIAHGVQILRHDKAREHTHRRMMRLFYLSGNRTGALHQYEQCAAILKEELGIQPGHATELLREQIETDKFQPQPVEQEDDTKPAPQSRRQVIQRMYGELQQIRDALMNIQHRVQYQADAVELMLKEESPPTN